MCRSSGENSLNLLETKDAAKTMAEIFIIVFKAICAVGVLCVGADMLVRGASALALRVGISALAVGLTVVAFGTSAPELVVSMNAALAGASDIAVGNVVGSNICNIALILGLAALIRPTVVNAKVVRLDAPLMVLVTLILVLMMMTIGLSRVSGALLVVGLVVYTVATVLLARREPESVQVEFSDGIKKTMDSLAVSCFFIVLGLAGLIVGGNLFVSSAVAMATAFGVSEAVIGLTIVALGTSLPELATSVVASAKGHGDIAVGNIIGSNLFNILGILGLTAVVQPLESGGITGLDLGVMFFLSVALLPILRSGFVISRAEGVVLLTFYFAYVGWLVVA